MSTPATPSGPDALSFCRSLIDVLPGDWSEEWPDEGAASWTQFMAEKLFQLGTASKLGVCSTAGGCAPANWRVATKATGWARELQFDFTMYSDWNDYSQPEIILEHENVWSCAAFMEDFWKLMFGYAPLRVMIGYHRKPSGIDEYLREIRRHARERAWRYPADTEDLVLIGHKEMQPREFRVVRRQRGSDQWMDWASLDVFVNHEVRRSNR